MEFVTNLLFGQPLTVEERIKEIHKTLDGAYRDLWKEKRNLETQKNRIVQELRTKAASSNRTSANDLKRLAMRCRRTERQIETIDATMDKVQDFKSMVSELRTNETMSRSFTKLTFAMKQMNSETGAFKLCALMQQFDREKMAIELKQEFIDEQLQEARDGDADSEEEEEMADNILQEVLDEFHIKLSGDMPDKVRSPSVKQKIESKEPVKKALAESGPSHSPNKDEKPAESTTTTTTTTTTTVVEEDKEEDDLLARIRNLK